MNFFHRTVTDQVTPLETAAQALYALSKPQDALPWEGMTSGQQDKYRRFATMAARLTDVTAVRAAIEAGAMALAAHKGMTLRDCTSQWRMGFRFDAMDCIRSFEDALMHGDAEKDHRVLELQREEHQLTVNKKHADAVKEDERETWLRDGRRDIAKYSGVPASGHDGELFGDGRR